MTLFLVKNPQTKITELNLQNHADLNTILRKSQQFNNFLWQFTLFDNNNTTELHFTDLFLCHVLRETEIK